MGILVAILRGSIFLLNLLDDISVMSGMFIYVPESWGVVGLNTLPEI